MTSIHDRREHPRRAVLRPCKVFHWDTQRYLPARTCDLSPGGALLRIDAARPLAPDDRVDVLIATDEHGLLRAAHQVRATVKRVLDAGDHRQFVAVEFDQQNLAIAA